MKHKILQILSLTGVFRTDVSPVFDFCRPIAGSNCGQTFFILTSNVLNRISQTISQNLHMLFMTSILGFDNVGLVWIVSFNESAYSPE